MRGGRGGLVRILTPSEMTYVMNATSQFAAAYPDFIILVICLVNFVFVSWLRPLTQEQIGAITTLKITKPVTSPSKLGHILNAIQCLLMRSNILEQPGWKKCIYRLRQFRINILLQVRILITEGGRHLERNASCNCRIHAVCFIRDRL